MVGSPEVIPLAVKLLDNRLNMSQVVFWEIIFDTLPFLTFSSLQHNFPRSFCLLLVFWNIFRVIQLSLCILWRHHFYVERVSWVGLNFSHRSLSSLSSHICSGRKLKEKRERSRKKRKQFVIGSRIRERDKKNEENYVGDYSFLFFLKSFFSFFQIKLFTHLVVSLNKQGFFLNCRSNDPSNPRERSIGVPVKLDLNSLIIAFYLFKQTRQVNRLNWFRTFSIFLCCDYFCLSVSLSVCLTICLSNCLSANLSFFLFSFILSLFSFYSCIFF